VLRAQDRVTDHRVPVTVHGVASFLEAGDQWDTIHAAVSSHEVDEHIRGILGE
jgi:protein subunit release factor A